MTREQGQTSGTRDPRLSGVVLAAGRSQRMGEPKQLLRLGGEIIVQHVVDAALTAGLDEVILVLGHAADHIEPALRADARARIQIVRTDDPEAGPGHSLAIGLAACAPEADAAVILLGDQPDISPELITRVIEAFEASSAPAVRPLWRDAAGVATPGHPVVLRRALWPALRDVKRPAGAGPLLDAHPDWVEVVELDGPAPADIDTWADYRRAGGVSDKSPPTPADRKRSTIHGHPDY